MRKGVNASSISLKKIVFLLAFITGALASEAQILHPAQWEHRFSKQSAAIGEEIDLIFDISIDSLWYLYSSDFDPELGPMVTEFHFQPHASYELIGGIRPINPKEGYDDIFEGNYTYFRGKGEFRQTIKILDKDLSISGNYAYQVCTDVDGKCIPFDEEFEFKGLQVLGATGESAPTPIKDTSTVLGEDTRGSTTATSEPDPPKIQKGSAFTERSGNSPYSLLAFMITAFLAGLVALMTPCVYPMIPMTVTFFTNEKQSRKKGLFKALFYGVSIVVIFTLLGTVVTLIWGPEFANWLATHWVPNLIFFAMFVFFALWFLGMFEINLPSGLVNSVDRKSEGGGILGVFFMALTLVLVSFSCTGPIVGTILIESATGHVLKPVVGMLGYSSAFAVTFSAFAIFPEWLKSLPKSGGWLNSIKIFLGFLELALSLKFLSIVDQVYHWGILDRDVFLAIWIAIFLALTAYLLGLIRFESEGAKTTLSVPRVLMGTLVLAFTLYLIPGLWGAPLKPLAGILPPMTTQDFQPANPLPISDDQELCSEPLYAGMLHLPHGLQGYFDLDQALTCAKEQGKPVFIDFTGHGCVNCREMEAVVWSHPEVMRRLQEDFVMVALYVDEKKELPEEDWYTSEYDQKVKKTIGKQNADLQIKWYGNNAQPFYILLDPQDPENPLVPPVAYDKSVSNFTSFLDAGIAAYRKNNLP